MWAVYSLSGPFGGFLVAASMLIAEDDPAIRRLVSCLLETKGFDIAARKTLTERVFDTK